MKVLEFLENNNFEVVTLIGNRTAWTFTGNEEIDGHFADYTIIERVENENNNSVILWIQE